MKQALKILAAALLLAAAHGAAAQTLEIVAGGTGVRNSAGERKWTTFRDNAAAKSGGAMDVRLLIFGELGPEENLVTGVRRGRVQFANWSGLVTTTVVPEMALLYAPFLFDNYAEADFIMDNFLFDAYADLLAEKDVHFLAWDEIGFNQIWATTPILTPEDIRHKRFRIAASDSARLFAEALQTDVIPLGFTDVVPSLQTGLIEAGENGVVLYARTGVADQAPHLTMTDHSFALSVIVARKRWWDDLTDDQRGILGTSWISMAESRRWTREEVDGDLARAGELGFTVHRLTPEQRARWKAATEHVSRRMIDGIGGRAEDIWDLVQEGKKAFEARNTPAP